MMTRINTKTTGTEVTPSNSINIKNTSGTVVFPNKHLGASGRDKDYAIFK